MIHRISIAGMGFDICYIHASSVAGRLLDAVTKMVGTTEQTIVGGSGLSIVTCTETLKERCNVVICKLHVVSAL